jgi:ABC-type antimicrobial peptide transport system permease subunit
VRLLEIFGQAAMALVALGVWAVARFAADVRRRELAIRAAFGATDRELVSFVVASEYRSLGLGIAIGLLLAWIVARTLETLLFGVSRSDPATYAAVALLLGGVTFVAAWVPVMRAARIDPAELLRA